jgi:thiol-disulfide isomerase/thioredoxin
MGNTDQEKSGTPKKSKITRLDVLWVILVVFLLIPSVRKELSTYFIRFTLSKAKIKSVIIPESLSPADLQWEFTDSVSHNYTLKDFRGQRIFLNFWATWCAPCRAEMPSIQELYNKSKDSTVFIMVCFEPRDAINSYITKVGLKIPVYYCRQKPTGNLLFQSFPTTFVISKEGRIIYKRSSAANYNSEEIIELLNGSKNKQNGK